MMFTDKEKGEVITALKNMGKDTLSSLGAGTLTLLFLTGIISAGTITIPEIFGTAVSISFAETELRKLLDNPKFKQYVSFSTLKKIRELPTTLKQKVKEML